MITGSLAILGAVALMLLGMPVGYTLALVGLGGFAAIVGLGPALSVFGQVAFDTVSNPNLVVLPLFLLMGNLVGASGMAQELYRAGNAFLGHRRGGLAMATVAACGAFAAICGSSIATSATMAKVALPEMKAYHYDDNLAAATVASGGTLGILIPPSIAMIVYGLLTQTSVGKLFIAGVVPGLIGIAGYLAAIAVVTALRPEAGPPGPRAPWSERFRSLAGIWAVVLLFVFIIAGIYAGAFTATEAAGMGACASLVIAALRGQLTLPTLSRIIVDTGRTTSMMFFLLIGAIMFSNFLEMAQFSREMGAPLSGARFSPLTVILGIVAIYIVLGCFLESLSMTFLTVPIFFPIVTGLGFDPVWFGILVVVVTEIALITPPVGMNIFVIQAMAPHLKPMPFYRALLPFIAADVVRLGLIIAFPAIVLFLPRMSG